MVAVYSKEYDRKRVNERIRALQEKAANAPSAETKRLFENEWMRLALRSTHEQLLALEEIRQNALDEIDRLECIVERAYHAFQTVGRWLSSSPGERGNPEEVGAEIWSSAQECRSVTRSRSERSRTPRKVL